MSNDLLKLLLVVLIGVHVLWFGMALHEFLTDKPRPNGVIKSVCVSPDPNGCRHDDQPTWWYLSADGGCAGPVCPDAGWYK